MTRRICLVTGGSGFVGCAVSEHLADRFDQVVVVDNLHPQIHAKRLRPSALSSSAILIEADISKPENWDRILDQYQPDCVLHLAAETGTGQSLTEASRHAVTNVAGTAEMLDGFARKKMLPSRFVLASSRAVYGEGAWSLPAGTPFYPGQRSRAQLEAADWNFSGRPIAMRADMVRPAPVSIYGATKLAQEHMLSSWCNSMGSELVILRFQNLYGPGQSLKNSYTGIVSLFCQVSRRGESIPLYEDGLMLRDFLLIDDAVEAIILATEKAGIAGKTFDVGAGVPMTVMDLATQIASIYGAPVPHVSGKYRHGDVRHAFTDPRPAMAELGWRARHSLADGLTALTNWIEEDDRPVDLIVPAVRQEDALLMQ